MTTQGSLIGLWEVHCREIVLNHEEHVTPEVEFKEFKDWTTKRKVVFQGFALDMLDYTMI